jgi:hypothetical protein
MSAVGDGKGVTRFERSCAEGDGQASGCSPELLKVCSGSCKVFADPRQQIIATAIPDGDSFFIGWSGGSCPIAGRAPCHITAGTEPIKLSPIFQPRKICQRDGWCWQNPLPQGGGLSGIWGARPDQVWASGPAGIMLFWNGQAWSRFRADTDVSLTKVWGSSESDVWAVGESGTVIRWQGREWQRQELKGVTSHFNTVTGTGPSDVWIAGLQSSLLHFDGAEWKRVDVQEDLSYLSSFAPVPGELWLGGLHGELVHIRGERKEVYKEGQTRPFVAIHGTSPSDVWFLTQYDEFGVSPGSLWHYDGQTLSRVATSSAGLASCGGLWTVPISASQRDVYVSCGDKILKLNGSVLSWHAQTSAVVHAFFGHSAGSIWGVGDGGLIIRWNGSFWTEQTSGPTSHLYGLHIENEQSVVAVGENTTWLHYSPDSWSNWGPNAPQAYKGVWGASPGNYWIATASRAIAHFSGTQGTYYDLPTAGPITSSAIWGSAADDIWVVGTQSPAHWDGRSWSSVPNWGATQLLDIWGASARDVWAVGTQGTIMRYDGTSWRKVASGTTQWLFGVHGSSANDVWIVGDWATVLHWDGARLTQVAGIEPSFTAFLKSVWAFSPSDVWIVGGKILHFDGTSWETSSFPALLYKVRGMVRPDGRKLLWAVGSAGCILHKQY